MTSDSHHQSHQQRLYSQIIHHNHWHSQKNALGGVPQEVYIGQEGFPLPNALPRAQFREEALTASNLPTGYAT